VDIGTHGDLAGEAAACGLSVLVDGASRLYADEDGKTSSRGGEPTVYEEHTNGAILETQRSAPHSGRRCGPVSIP